MENNKKIKMSYSISISDDKTYIIIKVKGEITGENAMNYNTESHALGRKLGISRYLVDVTEARNVDSVSRNFDFAYHDMQNRDDIDRSAHVATLVSPGDHSHDFIETVAQNAGLSVRLFTDKDAAVKYLKGGLFTDH